MTLSVMIAVHFVKLHCNLLMGKQGKIREY